MINSIRKCLVYLFMISLFLPLIFSNIITILLVIAFIISIFKSNISIHKGHLINLGLFASFFLIYVLGLFYSANLSEGLFTLEKKMSFIAIPLAFVGLSFSDKEVNRILRSYIIIASIVSIYLLIRILFKFLSIDSVSFASITNHELSSLIEFHATYLAMYLAFSILLSLHFYFIEQKRWIKYILIAVIFFTALVEFFLYARIVLIALFIICGVYLFLEILHHRRIQLIITLSFIFLTGALITWKVPALQERFKEGINYNSQYNVDQVWGGRSLRPLKWQCSLEIIKSNFFFGVGTGDAQDALNECYKNNNFIPLLYWPNVEYNAHNQFLEEFVVLGVIGETFFISILIVSLWYGYLTRNYYHIIFIVLFSIVCLTESILNSSKGIIFFCYFSTIFFSNYNQSLITVSLNPYKFIKS